MSLERFTFAWSAAALVRWTFVSVFPTVTGGDGHECPSYEYRGTALGIRLCCYRLQENRFLRSHLCSAGQGGLLHRLHGLARHAVGKFLETIQAGRLGSLKP